MTEPVDDKDLDDFMNRNSDISRRYGTLAIEEPPADLDRAILAQARAAVETPPEVIHFPVRSRTRWMVPFALAATVLLSFAIFREAGVGTGVVPLETTAPVDQVETVTPDQADSPAVQSPAAMEASPGQAQRLNEESRREADTQAKSAGSVANAAATAPVAISVPFVPPPEVAISVPASTPASNAVRTTAAERPPAAAPPSAGLASSESADAKALRTPEVWLEEIRKLRAAGQTSEADAELKRFLETNPGYFDRNPDVVRP